MTTPFRKRRHVHFTKHDEPIVSIPLLQQKRDRIASNFKSKLETLFSPKQKAAWEKAAAQELANAVKPKPQK